MTPPRQTGTGVIREWGPLTSGSPGFVTSTTWETPENVVEKPRLKDVLKRVKRIKRRTGHGGAWAHDPDDLIREFLSQQQSMDDP